MFKLLDWCFFSMGILFTAFWYSSSPAEYPLVLLGMLPVTISLFSLLTRKNNVVLHFLSTIVCYSAFIYFLLDILFDFEYLPQWKTKVFVTIVGIVVFAVVGKFKTDLLTSALTGFWIYVSVSLFKSKDLTIIFDLHNPMFLEKLKIVGLMMLCISIHLAVQNLLLKRRNTKTKRTASTQNKRKPSYSKEKNNFKTKEQNFKTNENKKYNF
ncbi:hypothetical protein [Priestia megaterium]|uniref:Uncharacterized protein n=1 Tax=Priestia megaterium TaxID=1404 RepID=A0A6M6E1X9_PRIMG|nr:hypothetical protein [Priestia megaterium]QJX80952.1 hypothetical protein FDZ14_33215 [Priestia megaterium]